MNDSLLYPVLICLTIAVALNIVFTFRLMSMVSSSRGFAVVPLTLPIGEAVADFTATTILDSRQVKSQNQSTVLLFLSSKCRDCKAKVPELALLPSALDHVGVAMWLVSPDSNKRFGKMLSGSGLIERAVSMEVSLMKTLNPRNASPFYLLIDDQRILQASGLIGDDNWISFTEQMQQIEYETELSK